MNPLTMVSQMSAEERAKLKAQMKERWERDLKREGLPRVPIRPAAEARARLRDELAMAALAFEGLCPTEEPEDIARDAYAVADAMLRAREVSDE